MRTLLFFLFGLVGGGFIGVGVTKHFYISKFEDLALKARQEYQRTDDPTFKRGVAMEEMASWVVSGTSGPSPALNHGANLEYLRRLIVGYETAANDIKSDRNFYVITGLIVWIFCGFCWPKPNISA